MTVVTVLGLAGGVGATREAIRLARRQRGLLIDLDLAGGDAAYRSGVHATTSLGDLLVLDPEAIDDSHLEALTFDANGFRLVASPAHPVVSERIAGGAIARVLELAIAGGSDIVIDAGSTLDAATVAAIGRSSTLLLVGRNDAWCARQATLYRGLLGAATRVLVSAGNRRASRGLANRCGDPQLAWDDGILARGGSSGRRAGLSTVGGRA